MKEREEASTAFVNGDFKALDSVSTHASPASIFGPKGDYVIGADEVNAANAAGAKMFADGAENSFEILHIEAGDTLAFWAGIQRSKVKMKGKADAVPMNLRVTETFRREDGEWKLVHRHADSLNSES